MTPMPRDDHERSASPGEAASATPDPESVRVALTRQKLVTRATIGLGSVMGAIIATPVAVTVLAPAFRKVKSHSIDIGPATLYPKVEPGQLPWHTVTFERAPDDRTGLERRLVYIRNDGNQKFTAVGNICMHVGCPVQASATGFAC